MSEKYKSLKVKELQEILQKNGLPHSGKKEELIDRLVKYDESKALESLDDLAGLEEFEESKLDLDSLDPDLKSLNDKPATTDKPKDEEGKKAAGQTEDGASNAAEAPSAQTSANDKPAAATSEQPSAAGEDAAAPKDDEPVKEVTKPGSSFKYTPITFGKKPASAPTAAAAAPAKPAAKPAAAATTTKSEEIEKKLERAKRFNVPVDDKTKMQLRAERFGSGKKTAPATTTATSSSGIDPEVLKRRAERFGIPSKEVEEDKKRKRAERFGVPEKKQRR